MPFLELPYFNGLGGFTKDGREYAIYLAPGSKTPAPWANVMANANFGTLVTESGLGFTWRGNSQTNRLTPWHNDPVTDPQSEVIYLRDNDSGACWTPTPRPIRENDAYRARHGQGYTVFEHNSHAIGQELTVFVPLNDDGTGDPVKVCRLRLRNDSSRRRRVTALYFAEWVLGTNREDQQPHIQTIYDQESGALFARQSWNGSQPNQIAFAAASPRAASYSGDRTAVLGRNRSASKPVALERMQLDNRAGAGLDPAAALQIEVSLERGAQVDVIFLLGEAGSPEEARAIISRYQTAEQVEQALCRDAQLLGIDAGRIAGAYAGSFHRLPIESVVAVPGSELPLLGPLRVLPVQRSFRLPRSASGYAGLRVCAPGDHAGTHPAFGQPAIQSKATCSIGGTPTPGWACARSAPTICCGCRTWCRITLRSRETPEFWIKRSRSWRASR